jgi:hypothetical protein
MDDRGCVITGFSAVLVGRNAGWRRFRRSFGLCLLRGIGRTVWKMGMSATPLHTENASERNNREQGVDIVLRLFHAGSRGLYVLISER